MTPLDLSVPVVALAFGALGCGVWTGSWRGRERESFVRAGAGGPPLDTKNREQQQRVGLAAREQTGAEATPRL